MNAPNPDAAMIMAEVDRMPKARRELVHEYGLVIVRHMDEMPIKELRGFLVAWREMRQRELLAANYMPQRGMRHVRAVRR